MSKKSTIGEIRQKAFEKVNKHQEKNNYGLYSSVNEIKIENTRLWKLDPDSTIE